MFRALMLASLALSATSASATEQPAPGGYGFDWLKPNSTKCRPVTEAQVKQFKSCEASPGFGGPKPLRACRVSARSEWIIYATRAQCEDELGTMRANAP